MKPGDFPIGSPESRAAARMRLFGWSDHRERIEVQHNIPRPGADSARFHFGAWQNCQDGKLFRLVYVPHVWLKPREAVPACPDCGMLFEKTTESPDMVGYTASCMGQHDPERAT